MHSFTKRLPSFPSTPKVLDLNIDLTVIVAELARLCHIINFKVRI